MATISVENRDMAGGGCARILRLTAPPVNALSQAMRVALHAALTAAIAAPGIRAIILTGAGRGFSGGLGPAALGLPQTSPGAGDIAAIVAASPKPVVAALHGLVLSAAAEIALAAHARVAGGDLRMGLRGALIGQLPDAGGTQRLPRLVGAAAAIRMLRDAVLVGAADALAMGLVDQVVRGDLLAAAMIMAHGTDCAPRAPGLRASRAYQVAVAEGRVGADALTQRMIDCLEAALILPMAQGLMFEAVAARDMAQTPRAAGLRAAMLADVGLAARVPGGVPGGVPVRHLGLWGTGVLALPALRAGMVVTIADTDRAALAGHVEKLALAQEVDVQAGWLTAAAREAEWGRLATATAPPVADLVIAGREGAVGQVVRLGPCDGGPSDGGPRLVLPAPGVAEVQLRAGDDGAVVVATLRRMGLRVAVTGPHATGVVQALRGAVARALQVMAAQGVAGAALTAGVPAWLRLDVPASTGHVVVDPLQVEARIMGALVAEGARLLAARVVQAGSDIDALAMAGLQMPRDLGGPLYLADQRGLLVVRRDLALWGQEDAVWLPDALFDGLIARGQGFVTFAADTSANVN